MTRLKMNVCVREVIKSGISGEKSKQNKTTKQKQKTTDCLVFRIIWGNNYLVTLFRLNEIKLVAQENNINDKNQTK